MDLNSSLRQDPDPHRPTRPGDRSRTTISRCPRDLHVQIARADDITLHAPRLVKHLDAELKLFSDSGESTTIFVIPFTSPSQCRDVSRFELPGAAEDWKRERQLDFDSLDLDTSIPVVEIRR